MSKAADNRGVIAIQRKERKNRHHESDDDDDDFFGPRQGQGGLKRVCKENGNADAPHPGPTKSKTM